MKKAQLIIDSQTFELPVRQGSVGMEGIDVSSLVSKGYLTFDPGFLSTASCESEITYVEGEQGILAHRGYSIEYLASHHSFLDVMHLLVFGTLPTAGQAEQLKEDINAHMDVPESMGRLFQSFSRDAHPMVMLASAVNALGIFYPNSRNISDPKARNITLYRMMAKLPTLVAMCYKHGLDKPFVPPKKNYSFTENFLHMMFSTPSEDATLSPAAIKAMELIFILHADHEQNASTSAVRMVASTQAEPFACLGTGVNALSGILHGGANELVIKMLEEIGSVERIPEFILRAKDKDDPFRLMGFGHRVYKNFDPRALILKEASHHVLAALAIKDPLLEVAQELERVALADPYFIDHKLYPNVDFYSGFIMKALNIPSALFTNIFALARAMGWTAQWLEQVSSNMKISRPRQVYTGRAIQKPE